MLCGVPSRISIDRLSFLGGDNSAGSEIGDGNAALSIGPVDAVIGTDRGSAAIGNQEFHAGEGLVLGARHQLLNDKGLLRSVGECNGLHIIGVHLDRLALGVGVDHIAGNRFDFLHDHGAHDAEDFDLARGIRGIDAVGGNFAAVHIHVGAVRVSDLELYARQRFLRYGVDLVDDYSRLQK